MHSQVLAYELHSQHRIRRLIPNHFEEHASHTGPLCREQRLLWYGMVGNSWRLCFHLQAATGPGNVNACPWSDQLGCLEVSNLARVDYQLHADTSALSKNQKTTTGPLT